VIWHKIYDYVTQIYHCYLGIITLYPLHVSPAFVMCWRCTLWRAKAIVNLILHLQVLLGAGSGISRRRIRLERHSIRTKRSGPQLFGGYGKALERVVCSLALWKQQQLYQGYSKTCKRSVIYSKATSIA
jgi:hypothetical protein